VITTTGMITTTTTAANEEPLRTMHGPASANPFATRYTKPGVIPPLDASGRPLDVPFLADRVQGGCSVIEGPHGRGKTTLVRALLAAATAAGRATSFVQVRSRASAWQAITAVAAARPGQLVAVDGWEQLPWGGGLVIAALACWRRAAVIATAHRPVGLPVLARCDSSPALVAAVVARLPDHGGIISHADVEEAFRRRHGNVRDALADLYDRFEERRR
jgi:hypothetical protein